MDHSKHYAGLNVVSMMITSFGNGRIRAIRRIKVTSKDEIGEVALVFKKMALDLEEKQQMEQAYAQAQNDQSWLNANVAQVTELLRGLAHWIRSHRPLSTSSPLCSEPSLELCI